MSHALPFYRGLLADIKTRVRQAQYRAAYAANTEMLRLYWDIGRLIAARQQQEGWGTAVIPRLAIDLKNELPEEKGFSATNLNRMVRFSREYPDPFPIGARPVRQLQATSLQQDTILPPPVAKLETSPSLPPIAIGAPPAHQLQLTSPQQDTISAQPVRKLETSPSLSPISPPPALQLSWAHNVILFEKIKDPATRHWYATQALSQGWSRDTLTIQIKNRAHERAGKAVTNFSTTLPTAHAALAASLLKDPYIFDFLTLEEPFHERELETGLLIHLQKFLLELGRGFAFVGRQYRLEVSDREFYLDLLFYHLHLRCFVVVELKKGDFYLRTAVQRDGFAQDFEAAAVCAFPTRTLRCVERKAQAADGQKIAQNRPH